MKFEHTDWSKNLKFGLIYMRFEKQPELYHNKKGNMLKN